jgi:hypothetical protein
MLIPSKTAGIGVLILALVLVRGVVDTSTSLQDFVQTWRLDSGLGSRSRSSRYVYLPTGFRSIPEQEKARCSREMCKIALLRKWFWIRASVRAAMRSAVKLSVSRLRILNTLDSRFPV